MLNPRVNLMYLSSFTNLMQLLLAIKIPFLILIIMFLFLLINLEILLQQMYFQTYLLPYFQLIIS